VVTIAGMVALAKGRMFPTSGIETGFLRLATLEVIYKYIQRTATANVFRFYAYDKDGN